MLRFKQFIEKEKIPSVMIYHGDQNSSIFESEDNLHNELSSSTKFTPKQLKEIREFANSSFPVNASLIGHHHVGQTATGNVHGISLPTMDSITKRKVGRKLTIHSGMGFDPRPLVNKDGLLHLPAYTSTSISKESAINFANKKEAKEKGHVLSLELNKEDKGVYLGDNAFPHEKEFLLPRNTTIKIHRSEEHPDGTVTHHGTIQHNVKEEDIERDTKRLEGLSPNFISHISSEGSGVSKENVEKLRNIPSLKPHVERAIKRGSPEKRLEKVKSSDVTDEDLDDALEDTHRIAAVAAMNPKAKSRHIDKALNSNNINVRSAAAINPNANESHLDKAIKDNNALVRRNAAAHRNANKNHLRTALSDSDSSVSYAARNNPNSKRYGLI